jgi:exonuclease III
MSITVATFNIWFDKYYIFERTNKIILEILQTKPRISVIALQEVTPAIFNFVKASLISEYYNFSTNEITQPYDTVILVDKNFKINKHIKNRFAHTLMARNLEFVSITNLKTKDNFLVGTSHLESEFNKIKDQPNRYKLDQFKESFTTLDNFTKESNMNYNMIIFMGDTNISNEENKLFEEKIPHGWNDFFIEFGSPKHLEFTYDHTKNNNTYFKSRSRLDRIYYKNLKNTMQPYTFSFLGQEPANGYLFLSDHFGVVACFSEV